MGIINFLKEVEFQILKSYGGGPLTDEEKIEISRSILAAEIRRAEDLGETLSDLGTMNSILGEIGVSWNEDNPEHDEFTLTLGTVSVTQDIDDANRLVVDTGDGTSDAEAVELDRAALVIGLGTNADLLNVETNLTFSAAGANTTVITWDATAHSGITNAGVVTTGGSDVTANVVATITKNAASTTETFSVIVLQTVSTDFVTSWKTDNTGYVVSNSDQVKLPLASGGTYNFDVNWGDGSSDDTITVYNDAAATHTFTGGAGTYTVTISGQCNGFGFAASGTDNSKLLDVSEWGVVGLHNNGQQFYRCDNLTGFTAIGSPDLSTNTVMTYMFRDATVFNGDISAWDTSSVTDMVGVFYNAIAFNQSLNWDTSSVTNMAFMFRNATIFNQSLNWDISSVTSMALMFYDAITFNQDISSWDISSITNMGGMFGNVTLSTVNYDALLNGFATLDVGETLVPDNITFGGGNSIYTSSGEVGRDILLGKGWTITDGGLV